MDTCCLRAGEAEAAAVLDNSCRCCFVTVDFDLLFEACNLAACLRADRPGRDVLSWAH